MTRGRSVERRAEQLVRFYPARWRARYGEEFVELLVDDLRERPCALRRDLDVVAHGVWSRLAFRGVVGDVVDAQRRRRSALTALAGVAVVFVVFGIGVWSQLAVGWAWSAPTDPGTRTAMVLMSGALLGLAFVTALVIAMLFGAAISSLFRGGTPRPWRPAVTMLAAAVGLYLGCHHFGAAWPGTGGHPWSGRGLVPAWVARLGWAGTLWISAYWAHPAELRSFPASQVAWMALSPAAWMVLFGAGLRFGRHAQLRASLERLVIVAAGVAVGLMAVFLAGAGTWVLTGGPGPSGLFAAGKIDLVTVAMLGSGLIFATHLLWRAGTRPAGRVLR
jgi:hypothetical protein